MWITNARRGQLPGPAGEDRPRRRAAPHRHDAVHRAEGATALSVAPQAPQARLQGVDTVEVVFEKFVVPDDRLLGGVEGRGFAQTQGASNSAASTWPRGRRHRRRGAARLAGVRARRQTMGKPIGEHQAIQLKLPTWRRVEAARLLTYSAPRQAFDRGERCDMEAGMAKLVATEAALENATEAMRIHGAYGYSKEVDIERYYRDAPLLSSARAPTRSSASSSPAIRHEGSRYERRSQGIRIVAVEQYRRRRLTAPAACGPRRGGHQDRECGHRWPIPRARPGHRDPTTANITKPSTPTRRVSRSICAGTRARPRSTS